MPYKIVYVKNAKRPWVIKRADTGETVGSSASEAMAKASIRARWAGENKK